MYWTLCACCCCPLTPDCCCRGCCCCCCCPGWCWWGCCCCWWGCCGCVCCCWCGCSCCWYPSCLILMGPRGLPALPDPLPPVDAPMLLGPRPPSLPPPPNPSIPSSPVPLLELLLYSEWRGHLFLVQRRWSVPPQVRHPLGAPPPWAGIVPPRPPGRGLIIPEPPEPPLTPLPPGTVAPVEGPGLIIILTPPFPLPTTPNELFKFPPPSPKFSINANLKLNTFLFPLTLAPASRHAPLISLKVWRLDNHRSTDWCKIGSRKRGSFKSRTIFGFLALSSAEAALAAEAPRPRFFLSIPTAPSTTSRTRRPGIEDGALREVANASRSVRL